MFGKILIYITFVFALLTVLFYLLHYNKKIKSLLFPRFTFHISVISVLLASSYLLSLILNHQFQYTYVWEYSSRDLSFPLLLSTFYAGQEGSFLLWLLFSVIIGVFLLTFIKKYEEFESPVMIFYSLVIVFLSLLLILQSPFQYVWETFPKEAKVGFVPQDGRGLNPILQNFWMVIHPPVLFIGFASLAVPFSFSVSALLTRKYQKWIYLTLPWLLFSTGILGAGIILGAFWAYGVLGWGGYWSWDPVENSSLIPWIFSVAAVHTMIAQQITKKYVITNILLNIFSFIFVLYSTFLTRSGILADASVHSFVKPGNEIYITLLSFIILFLILSLSLFFYRFKKIKVYADSVDKGLKVTSKENIIFIGSVVLIISAFLILIGTSLPIVSSSKVDADSYYNQTNMILAIAFVLLAGIAFFLSWEKNIEKDLKELWIILLISFIVTAIIGFVAVQNLFFLLFIFTCVFTLFVSVVAIVKKLRLKNFKVGFAIGHLGLVLFFLGIIGSAKYSEETNLELEKNVPYEAFGYKFTYFGDEEFLDNNNKKYYLLIKVEKDNQEIIMKPVMYYSSYMNSVMKEPHIKSFLTKDLYISPLELIAPQPFSDEQILTFKTNEVKEFDKLKMKFLNVDVSQIPMRSGNINSRKYSVFANFEIYKEDKKELLKLELIYNSDNSEPVPMKSTIDTNYTFYFTGINVDNDGNGTVVKVAVVDSKNNIKLENEKLIVSVSVKPFIGILWIGSILLIVGFFYSIFNRVKMLKNTTDVKK